MAKSPITPPAASALGRFFKLAGTAARIGGGLLGQRLSLGRSAIDWQPVGDLLSDVLGEMKGPVLKLGQMASQWQGVLPEPVAQALSKLQNRVPALPFSALQGHLQQAYGDDLSRFFQSIEEQPFAAASLGQVHRAVALDGRALVLKVQYPGIAEICAADLRQLRRLLPLGRLFRAPAAQLEGVYQELVAVIDAELDYPAEMRRLQHYRAHFADWPGLRLPQPQEDLCRPGVLALSEEPGLPFAEVGQASAEVRERLALTLVRWLSAQAFELGLLHADPHPGNFAYTPAGELVVYDFGCVRALSPALLGAYVQTYQALQARDGELLEQAFQALGTRQPRSTTPYGLYRQLHGLLGPLLQPGVHWDFAATPLHEQVQRLLPDVLGALGSLQPAPATLLINRTLEGHYWNLSRLGVALPLADVLQGQLTGR
ncbi:MAG: AarF/ABC1/UbiB kinase family protein [Pseudomonas sp.]|jgi:predicted unusual protein kinase regulating ubiquinone biosynthesis (AarF/ABC1/UbiB family)|nr:AarF/ABC1/UbiB kinase family protein [Pseudomonas sp.]